jgi:hypothetical protein
MYPDRTRLETPGQRSSRRWSSLSRGSWPPRRAIPPLLAARRRTRTPRAVERFSRSRTGCSGRLPPRIDVLPGRLALPLGATARACRAQLLPRPRALPTEPHAGSMVSPRRGQQRTASAVVRSSYSLTIRATRRGDGGVRHLGDRRRTRRPHPRGGPRQQGADVRLVRLQGRALRGGLRPPPGPHRRRRAVHAPTTFRATPSRSTTPTSPTPSSCVWRAGTGLSASRPASCSPPTRAAPNQARGDRARPSRGRDRRGYQARRRLRAHRRARRHVVADQRHVHRFARGERRRA